MTPQTKKLMTDISVHPMSVSELRENHQPTLIPQSANCVIPTSGHSLAGHKRQCPSQSSITRSQKKLAAAAEGTPSIRLFLEAPNLSSKVEPVPRSQEDPETPFDKRIADS